MSTANSAWPTNTHSEGRNARWYSATRRDLSGLSTRRGPPRAFIAVEHQCAMLVATIGIAPEGAPAERCGVGQVGGAIARPPASRSAAARALMAMTVNSAARGRADELMDLAAVCAVISLKPTAWLTRYRIQVASVAWVVRL